MKTIYIDSDFKCHAANDGTMRPVDTDFFDGKCDAFIEGHRCVPADERWTTEHGTVCTGGEMIAPWKSAAELDAAQREYEKQLLAECSASLNVLGVKA